MTQTKVKVPGYSYCKTSTYKLRFGQKKVSKTVSITPEMNAVICQKFGSLSKAMLHLYNEHK